MERVHQVLVVLQPVAGDDGGTTASDAAVVGLQELPLVQHVQALVAGQHRLALGRAHVGPYQAVELLHGVPGLPPPAPGGAALGLAGLLQAMALHVEQPAVVAAADAALLHLAVIERGAPVRAVRMHQAGPAGPVAKQDQVLAQHPDLARRGGGIGGQPDGVPVAAQQLAHGLAGADFGQFGAVGGGRSAVGRAGIQCRRCFRGVHGGRIAEGWGRLGKAGKSRRKGALAASGQDQSAVTPATLINSATRG